MQRKTIVKIIKQLNKLYLVKPWEEDPFKILIATIISQRTKDEVTRRASEKLFKVADSPQKMMKLSEREIAKLIYPAGFYRQKAKRIKTVSKILLERYKGKVPKTREELLKLPGVGFKTSDVVLSCAYGKPFIAVDVHVKVLARRLGLSESKDPEKIREDLHKLVPIKFRGIVNLLFVEFGKDVCRTVKPRCSICPIKNYCKYYRLHYLK